MPQLPDHSKSLPNRAVTPPQSIRVAAVQMAFAPSLAGNLKKIEQFATHADEKGADAVLFPECATTGYACDFGALNPGTLRHSLGSIAAIASKLQINLMIGSPIYAGRKLYNAMLVFDRRGHLVHTYAKCQLVEADRQWFTPGNGLSLFSIDGISSTAIICHERRYPELVRIPAMAGARIVFHPNAGMDVLKVSRGKRNGRDGMPVRAFENATYYVFANSVGPQGKGRWSAGDSKIVAPNGSFLEIADNRREAVIIANLDLTTATGKYPQDSLQHPRFLASHWRRILPEFKRRVVANDRRFRGWFESCTARPR